jgi:hypothetical protein
VARGHAFILIALYARPDGYPLSLRVRRLLKFALRALGLRCLFVDWTAMQPVTNNEGEN